MTLEVVTRGRKFRVLRDPAWPAGVYRQEFGIHDLHYRDDAQVWQDVVETLEDDTLTGFAHKADRMAHAIHIGTTGTRRWMPRREHPEEYIEFGRLQSWTGSAWQNVNLGTPTRSGNQITWNTTAFTLTLTVTWRHVKILAVLKTENARRRLRWAVSLSGLTWDAWSLRGADNSVVGWIDAPTAWDANGSADNPNVTITTSYAAGFVEFGGDLSQAVLPITIDPTFTDGYGGDVQTYMDTRINSFSATTNFATGTVLGVGDAHGARNEANRLLIQFDPSSIPAGSTIDAVSFKLNESGAGTTGGVTSWDCNVQRVLRAWTEAGATWNTYDGTNNWTTAGCGSDGNDRVAAVSAALTLDGTSGGTFLTWSGAGLVSDVQDWLDGAASNYGWLVSSPTAEFQGDAGFAYNNFDLSDHATASRRPVLVVDYTAGGGAPARAAQVLSSEGLYAPIFGGQVVR